MQPLGADDPRRIGDYRLLGVLGSGGMGKVFLGRNGGGRAVAVKVIRPDLLGDPELRARFRREVAAAQRVGGAFTAPVLDADVDAEPPWLATGYVAGLALSDAVAQFGRFSGPALLGLAHGLARALVAVHAVEIVHRDLKPSNVLLGLDGPKLIDFGIARTAEDTALTATGRVIGSPGFMCPEQVTGEPLGPPCDVFALGGVLVFAATGHGPFGTVDMVQALWRIVYEQPHLDAVPPTLRPLVESCLAKDPAARPTSEQLLAELARLGPPEHVNWLPQPILQEVSLRAVRLLELDTSTSDSPPTPPPASATLVRDTEHGVSPTVTSGRGAAPRGDRLSQPADQDIRHREVAPNRMRPTVVNGSGMADRSRPREAGPGVGPSRTEPDEAATRPNRFVAPKATGFPKVAVARNATGHPKNAASSRATAPPRGTTSPRATDPPQTTAPSRGTVSPRATDPPQTTAPSRGTAAPKATDPSKVAGRSAAARRWTRRGYLIGALVTVVAAVGAGAYLINMWLFPPTSLFHLPGDQVTTVPAAYVGTWTGTVTDLVQFDVIVTIEPGEVGQKLATSTNTNTKSGEPCNRSETLRKATTGGLELQAEPPRGPRCSNSGDRSTVRMLSDGELAYTVDGISGTLFGILRRN